MLEMKIGEIKIMALKCVEAMDYDDDSCEGCLFYDRKNCNWPYSDKYLGDCRKVYRLDKKNVIFVSTDPNEIIRERIEKSIDKWSNGDDDIILSIESNGGDYRIGFKASYWKQLLGEILKLEEEKEESEC